MSDQERTRFFKAVTAVYNDRPKNGSILHRLDYFGWAHTQAYDGIHQNPSFFPWHRYFLQIFQLMILQKDPYAVIPYWDWTKDSQEPHKSEILSGAYYGGNGNKNQDYQVQNGFMKNWEMHFPDTHTIKRCFHKTDSNGTLLPSDEMDPLPDPTLMNSVINQYKTYSEFAWNAELYHGFVHVLLGGDHGEMGPPWSPNDLIFFLHHAYMDRLWWLWQKRYPELATAYDGDHYDQQYKVSTDDILNFPGGLQTRVSQTFDTTVLPLCYTYTEPSQKTMLSGEDAGKIVKGTNITKENVNFDTIDTLKTMAKEVNDNPSAPLSETVKDALKVEQPKVKPLNPNVPFKMMRMENPERAAQKIIEDNKKIEFISSLKGFSEQPALKL